VLLTNYYMAAGVVLCQNIAAEKLAVCSSTSATAAAAGFRGFSSFRSAAKLVRVCNSGLGCFGLLHAAGA